MISGGNGHTALNKGEKVMVGTRCVINMGKSSVLDVIGIKAVINPFMYPWRRNGFLGHYSRPLTHGVPADGTLSRPRAKVIRKARARSAPAGTNLLTVKELAQILNIKEKTLYQWVEMRQIPHIRLNRCIRFDRAAIDSWVNDCRQAPDRRYNIGIKLEARKGGQQG